jgi:hypothetical protein
MWCALGLVCMLSMKIMYTFYSYFEIDRTQLMVYKNINYV